MKNLEISRIFRDIANVLEIKGGNPFRIRAYERAAQNIEGLSEDIENFVREERLTEISGIGKDLSERIKEFIRTGKIKIYEDLKKTVPEGLLELLNIPSVGPKTARLLYEKLKIKSIADLEKAIEKNKLKGIFGIKEKTVENILKGIELLKRGKARLTLARAMLVADEFIKPLEKAPGVKKVSCAGSLRRQKETVRDIDILVVSNRPQKVMDAFTKIPQAKDVQAQGSAKSSLRTKEGVQVDCRVVEEESFGAALLYFTGSKNFNIRLRQMAIRKGLKINEYGVFSAIKSGGSASGGRKEKFICGATEEEIFKTLGMSYVEPEMRENTGEIELALKNKLPHLIQTKDIKGDLHVHSAWSDGTNTIQEIVQEAQNKGYEYIAVTDHSQSLKVAGGLSPADLKKKKRQIDKINKGLRNFRVFYGTEVDIDSDGKIDYKDAILKEFDLVVAAIHTGFKQPKEQLTRRIIRACQNKYVNIIAHPTGRLWGVREPYEIDFDKIFKAAKETNTSFEINAFPERLDLNDVNCRRAKEMGVRLSLGTDSHTIEHLELMKLGIAMARRGWLTTKDVINTLGVEELLKVIKK